MSEKMVCIQILVHPHDVSRMNMHHGVKKAKHVDNCISPVKHLNVIQLLGHYFVMIQVKVNGSINMHIYIIVVYIL